MIRDKGASSSCGWKVKLLQKWSELVVLLESVNIVDFSIANYAIGWSTSIKYGTSIMCKFVHVKKF